MRHRLAHLNAAHIPKKFLGTKKDFAKMQSPFFGGSNRARTCDPLLVRQMLSQLSYTSECAVSAQRCLLYQKQK